MSERTLTRREERIEAAIARFWPDLDKVIRVTGATLRQVAYLVARLERVNAEPPPRR